MKSSIPWPVVTVTLFALLLTGMPCFAEVSSATEAKAEVVASQPVAVTAAAAPVLAAQPATATPVPIVVTVQAAPAAAPVATVSNATPAFSWFGLLTSPQALAIEITLLVAALKWLHDSKGLETDRWGGLMLNLYNSAEQAGILNGWSGKQKLDDAMSRFALQFQQTFGTTPKPQDYADAHNDLAKIAYDDDSTATKTAKAPALLNPGPRSVTVPPNV